LFRTLLDLIYPPLCISCHEPCETRHFCPECWELCAPPDPVGRCRHCFEPLDGEELRCAQCKEKPLLIAKRAYVFDRGAPIGRFLDESEAMAAYAYYQWIQLEWETPDFILPFPDKRSLEIGGELASLMHCPLIKAFREADTEVELKRKIPEGKTLLLFDVSAPARALRSEIRLLSDTSPVNVLLFSLLAP
jgi:predicted amidophosphoribosyltransferase